MSTADVLWVVVAVLMLALAWEETRRLDAATKHLRLLTRCEAAEARAAVYERALDRLLRARAARRAGLVVLDDHRSDRTRGGAA